MKVSWRDPGRNGRFWGPFLVHWNSKNVKNHETLLFHYSVRQKIGDPGPISMQNMFPLLPVTPKRPELPYGAKYYFLASFSVFGFFPYWTPIGSLLTPLLTPPILSPSGRPTPRRHKNTEILSWNCWGLGVSGRSARTIRNFPSNFRRIWSYQTSGKSIFMIFANINF